MKDLLLGLARAGSNLAELPLVDINVARVIEAEYSDVCGSYCPDLSKELETLKRIGESR